MALSSRYLHRRTLPELTARTSLYPALSLGDLVGRALHHWDNTHGLGVVGGGTVFDDAHIDQGQRRALAGSRLSGEAVYRSVCEATGADDGRFVAEAAVPRPSQADRGDNWWAADAESLWASPMVGSSGLATAGASGSDDLSPSAASPSLSDAALVAEGCTERHRQPAARPVHRAVAGMSRL